MRKLLIIVVPIVCCGIAVAAMSGRVDQGLAQLAANVDRLHKVTETPQKMMPDVVVFCRPRPEAPHSPHDDFYFHIFVNDVGLATLKSGEGTYPVGSVIVKQKFADEAGTQTELFTLMRKRESGYDAEHGDWEYSIVDRTAKKVLSRGRTDSCIDCHAAYADTDYVTRDYMPSLDRNAKQ